MTQEDQSKEARVARLVHEALSDIDKRQISTPPDFWDKVDKPAHYCKHKHTCVEIVADWELDFFLGNVVKYIERHKLKGDPEGDLRKARKYLEMKIELLEKGELKETITHG